MRAFHLVACTGAVLILACDSPSDSSGGAIASIRVEPPLLAAMRGETSTLTATGYDAQDRAIPGVAFTWSSTSSEITVSNGQVSATEAGSAVVTASAGNLSGAAHVRVGDCQREPAPLTVVAQGMLCYGEVGLFVDDTMRVRALLADGSEASGGAWTSSNTSVATVNSQGLVAGLMPGATVIRGTFGIVSDTLVVVVDTTGTIEFVPDVVTLAPDSSAVLLIYPRVGGLMAPSTHFANLQVSNSAVIRETYANANLETIFLLVTGAAEGETTLTYTYRTMTGSALVTVRR